MQTIKGAIGRKPYSARILWAFLGAFALRVAGQLAVALDVAPFLPPFDQWQSGLLPYPLLLVSQIVILVLLGTVCVQFSRGRGYFVEPRRWLATPLWVFGWLYAASMLVRYALLRKDAIPVFFHIVLAGFALMVAGYHRQHIQPPSTARIYSTRGSDRVSDDS